MKVGIVTYVHGWYADYIPFFVYAISKSYPEYESRIFLRETLPNSARRNLALVRGLANFQIQEGYLANIGIRDDEAKKPYYLRWLTPYYSLKDLDAAFICDVDLLMISESPTMLDQRLAVCARNGVPFANYERDFHPDYPPRITGWHFILVDEYYKKVGPIIDKLRNEDIDITAMKNNYCYENGLGEKQWGQESLLHYIIREAFGDVDLSHKFPTHHGVHLGPIRANLHHRLYNKEPKIIKRFGFNADYWYSPQAFQFANDDIIIQMARNLPNGNVKTVITRYIESFTDRGSGVSSPLYM